MLRKHLEKKKYLSIKQQRVSRVFNYLLTHSDIFEELM